MNINKRAKLVVGILAIAGSAAFAGNAFTGTGVTTTGQASSAQFVGGTVSQSVTGATLDSIAYDFTDGTNTVVNEVTLTFTGEDADLKVPTIVFTGGSGTGTWTCDAIDDTTHVSVCDGGTRVGTTSIAVTVS